MRGKIFELSRKTKLQKKQNSKFIATRRCREVKENAILTGISNYAFLVWCSTLKRKNRNSDLNEASKYFKRNSNKEERDRLTALCFNIEAKKEGCTFAR